MFFVRSFEIQPELEEISQDLIKIWPNLFEICRDLIEIWPDHDKIRPNLFEIHRDLNKIRRDLVKIRSGLAKSDSFWKNLADFVTTRNRLRTDIYPMRIRPPKPK